MLQQKGRIAVVVAHPDDETLGLGGQLIAPLDATFIYATDGAPRNLNDARTHGFQTWEEYQQARRAELSSALSLTALPALRIREIGIADQQAAANARQLADALSDCFADIRPNVILTHPFEGGHPDHDAVALAVHVAARNTSPKAELMEFTSYHSREGALESGRFLDESQGEVVRVDLSEAAYRLKQEMVECFKTQVEFIRQLCHPQECFRASPDYDFRQRPHAGPLFYETWDSGWVWDSWMAATTDISSSL